MPQKVCSCGLSFGIADSMPKCNKIKKEAEMSKKTLLIIGLLLVLSACSLFGSYYEPEAVGPGKDINELKLSPCACMQVEIIKNVPDWFFETI